MGESRVQKKKKKPKVFIGKELLWSKENEGCVFAEDLHHPEVCISTLPSLARTFNLDFLEPTSRIL